MQTPSPHRRRKLPRILAFVALCIATLVALFYVIENWRGKRAIESFQRDVNARGETLDFHALVPPPVPDSENFVATPTVNAWFKAGGKAAQLTNLWPECHSLALKALPATRDGERHITDLIAWQRALAQAAGSTTNDPPGTREAAARAVLQLLEIYEPVLNEFRANASRPQARFPIDYTADAPFAILLPHLSPIRGVAQVLSLRACAELAAGNSSAALRDTLLGLRLAESLKTEPFIISQLVRLALLHNAVQPIWEGIETALWSTNDLRTLQSTLDQIQFLPDLARTMQTERAAGLTAIELARRSQLGDYLSALGRGGSDPTVPSGDAAMNLAGKFIPRGWFYLETANFGRMLEDQIRLARAEPFDPRAVVRAADTAERRLKGGLRAALIDHNIAAGLLLPALGKVSVRFTSGEILLRQASAACAIERYRLAHGPVPETLDSLVPEYISAVPYDYFARQPMVYRRESPQTFILFSIGANGVDNGGKPGKRPFDNTGDWVWTQQNGRASDPARR